MQRNLWAYAIGLVYVFFASGQACLQAGEATPVHKRILVLTIPKSGTHLIVKAVERIVERGLLGSSPPRPVFFWNLHKWIPSDGGILYDHFLPEHNYLKDHLSDNVIKIIGVRDPRDIMMSQVYWMQENPWWGIVSPDKFNQLSFDEKIIAAILLPDKAYGIGRFVRNALDWMKNPTVFVCRFEDFVGPEGGGSRKRQEEAIKALAKHLGYPLEPGEAAEIADQLFGGTWTFRSGQIGGWREYFTPEHVKLFKQAMGKELIELGYEVDDQW